MQKDTTHRPPNKWEPVPYNLRGGWCLTCLFLGCSMLGACTAFSASTRHNEGSTVACVDRDLSNGDSCSGSNNPAQEPGGADLVSP